MKWPFVWCKTYNKALYAADKFEDLFLLQKDDNRLLAEENTALKKKLQNLEGQSVRFGAGK